MDFFRVIITTVRARCPPVLVKIFVVKWQGVRITLEVEDWEAWLKSVEMRTRNSGYNICSCSVTVCRGLQTATALANGDVHCYRDDMRQLPWEVVWQNAYCSQLSVSSVVLLLYTDVPWVMLSVIFKHFYASTLPDFHFLPRLAMSTLPLLLRKDHIFPIIKNGMDGLYCLFLSLHFIFHKAAKIFIGWQASDCRQASFFAEYVLALSCINKQDLPWKRHRLLGSMLLHNLSISSRINGVFTNVQVTHAICTNAPLYHHRCWHFNCSLIISWMVPFLFSPDDVASMIPKWISNLDLSSTEQFLHLTSVHLKWARDQRRWRCFWMVYIHYSFNFHLRMQRQTMFTDSDFWKCSWAFTVLSTTELGLFLMQCRLRARISQPCNVGF